MRQSIIKNKVLCPIMAIIFLLQACASTSILGKETVRGNLLTTASSENAKQTAIPVIKSYSPTSLRIYKKIISFTEQRKKYEKIEKITEQSCVNHECNLDDPGQLLFISYITLFTLGIWIPIQISKCLNTNNRNLCKKHSSEIKIDGENIEDIEYIQNGQEDIQIVTSGHVIARSDGVVIQEIAIHADGTAKLDLANLLNYAVIKKNSSDLHVTYEYENASLDTTIPLLDVQKALP